MSLPDLEPPSGPPDLLANTKPRLAEFGHFEPNTPELVLIVQESQVWQDLQRLFLGSLRTSKDLQISVDQKRAPELGERRETPGKRYIEVPGLLSLSKISSDLLAHL